MADGTASQWKVSQLNMVDLVHDGYKMVAILLEDNPGNIKTVGFRYYLQKENSAFVCEEYVGSSGQGSYTTTFVCAELVKLFLQPPPKATK